MAYNPKHSLAAYAIDWPLTSKQLSGFRHEFGRFAVATVGGLEVIFDDSDMRAFLQSHPGVDPAAVQPAVLLDYGDFFHGEVGYSLDASKFPTIIAARMGTLSAVNKPEYEIVVVRGKNMHKFRTYEGQRGVSRTAGYRPSAATQPVWTPPQEIPGARYGSEHISKILKRKGWDFPKR